MSWIDKYTDSEIAADHLASCHYFDMRTIDLKSQIQELSSTINSLIEEKMFHPPYPKSLFRINPNITFEDIGTITEMLIVARVHGDDSNIIAIGQYNITNIDNVPMTGQCVYHLYLDSGAVKEINLQTQEETFLTGDSQQLRTVDYYLAALCLIYSRSVEKEPIVISEQLNAKRERNGRPRLSDYHIVTLPNRFHYSNETEQLPPEERRYVRAHWRRGHVRHQPTNKGIRKLFIAPVLVCGDREFVAKHYEYKRAA